MNDIELVIAALFWLAAICIGLDIAWKSFKEDGA